MDIDEAIDEFRRGTEQSRSTNNQRLREALRLGIEALTYIKLLRQVNPGDVPHLFSGETEEVK